MQIDCVVRLDYKEPIYVDVQIKARSQHVMNAASFSDISIRDPRPNYFFIFYCEAADTYWVMPSLEGVEKARRIKSGGSEGNFKLNFCNKQKDGEWKPRPKWEEYENKFSLIEEYAYSRWRIR